MDKSKNDDKAAELKVLETGNEKPVDNVLHARKAVTNPIAKNFVKYFASPKGKFSIKDILR